jgi:hypothetical protein
MISTIDIILKAGQNLTGVTKSDVDLSIKNDATNPDRQAALFGYLGVLGSVGEKVFDRLNQPDFAPFFVHLGGGGQCRFTGQRPSESHRPGSDPTKLQGPCKAGNARAESVQRRGAQIDAGHVSAGGDPQGRRTVLEYLLSPVQKVTQEAGRERQSGLQMEFDGLTLLRRSLKVCYRALI